MQKEKISFKPLHEGMGFHPFSDGLPYTPESKSKYQNGSGATAAGRPQFATATAPSLSRNPVRTARQLQTLNAEASARNTILNPSALETPSVRPAKTISSETTAMPESSLLRRRGFAYLLDSILHAGFWLGTNLTALFLFKFQIDAEILRDHFGQFIAFLMFSQWMFIALQEVLFETTIGKAFFNLEFKRSHSSLFLRSIVFMLGALCLGAGFYFRPQDKLGELQLKAGNPNA
jgi:hypothetical protein